MPHGESQGSADALTKRNSSLQYQVMLSYLLAHGLRTGKKNFVSTTTSDEWDL